MSQPITYSSGKYKPLNYFNESMSSDDPIERKLRTFISLQEGWNYGEGSPPNQSTINKSIELYRFGKTLDLECEVFPIGEGDIEVSLYISEHFIDILVKSDGSMELTYEIGIGNHYDEIDHVENISESEIRTRLRELRRTCSLSESLETITIRENEDLHIGVLGTTKVEFPLFIKDVSCLFIIPQYAAI